MSNTFVLAIVHSVERTNIYLLWSAFASSWSHSYRWNSSIQVFGITSSDIYIVYRLHVRFIVVCFAAIIELQYNYLLSQWLLFAFSFSIQLTIPLPQAQLWSWLPVNLRWQLLFSDPSKTWCKLGRFSKQIFILFYLLLHCSLSWLKASEIDVQVKNDGRPALVTWQSSVTNVIDRNRQVLKLEGNVQKTLRCK